MKTKYVDIPAIVQVIGGIYNNPSLLDNEDKYHFLEEDFTEEFHKILFGSIYNLYKMGVQKIGLGNIEDYLVQKPKSYSIYKSNNGSEYLIKISNNTQLSAFDYYYNRVKKMTLFRAYEDLNMDLSWLYDPNNILNVKKKQEQEEWFDNTSLEEIAEIIDNKITDIRLKYINNAENESHQAAEGVLDLLEKLKKEPEVGCPLFGSIINTITRGARLSKFYLRSAPSGIGKSRAIIADCCYIGCDELYDNTSHSWIKNGTKESCLYISTELGLDEVQTMMIAFISDVDEEHILNGYYEDGEWERVVKASNILKNSKIYVQQLFDFSLKDLENCIKVSIRENKTKYIFHDYIHSSLKILSEISSSTSVKGLREDNILFMISTRLKDICNEYGIFILSSTQLNGGWKTETVFDQNLLRGEIVP